MSDFLDETPEEQESREKFEYFFGQYSAQIRKSLLSKNISKPANLYDILYTKVRQDLLAKNETIFNINLDESALNVRNNLLSKHVDSQINLDVTGENFRQSQLSKNKLIQTSVELNKVSDQIREGLLSKNVNSNIDLSRNAASIRENNLSNNVEKNINLDNSSAEIRNNLISKNKTDNKNLDSEASSVRNSLLSSNVHDEKNIDNISVSPRENALSKNIDKNIDLDKSSANYRDVQSSKNSDKEINLDNVADSVRNISLSKNKDSSQNLEDIASNARNSNESKNLDNAKDLDKLSESVRLKMESNNVDSKINLDDSSKVARGNQESKNNDLKINLDNAANKFRSNMLSSNKTNGVDLDNISEKNRNAMLSANKTDAIDINKLSDSARKNLLSNNKEENNNLDNSAASARNNLLSNNVPENINLDADSTVPRNSLLSNNVPNNIDLDANSVIPRNSLLASNVPDNIDLDASSITPRNNLLSSNVPDNIDLDANSTPVRNSLLASNVPDNIDLDANSAPVRNSLLANNVPDNIDLDSMSAPSRASLLASNVPDNIDLDANSTPVRNSLLASNVPDNIDLDLNSLVPRNNLLSNNIPNNIDLDVNALLTRNNLLASNVENPNQMEALASIFRHDLLSKNDKANGLGTNLIFGGTSTFIGVSNLEIVSAPIRTIMVARGNAQIRNSKLQSDYGLGIGSDGVTPLATITNAAQLYNLQKNPFMSIRFSDKTSGYNLLLNHHTDGFQQLLSILGPLTSKRETETNTTPANVIAQNNGVYVGLPTNVQNASPVTKILKPTDGNLGTAASMMANTVPSDMIAANFNKNERGVSRIINTIRKDSSISMAKNYDSQNNNSFIIGTNSDGSNKLAYSRYTIANPYQPNKDAGTLELRIKNYAIFNGNKRLVHTMSFPPYIKSFANSDTANWNKVDYVGRPEPVYTYSNSNREGSLSFYVLTDYSQTVDIGYDFANKTALSQTFTQDFTSQIDKADKNSDIEAEIVDKQNQIAAYNEMLSANSGNDVGGNASMQAKIVELNLEISNLQAKQKANTTGKNLGPNRDYKEFDTINGNVYKTLINNGKAKDSSGNIDLKTEETAQRLARMKKDLLFQPSFFSGDKVDFLTRMEFLAKLTRPARNASNKGFSFTFPPVCHLHLGDFINHDIIINNVSYDYSDSPWTIDGSGGRVQPMWALVNISFNIIGTYEGLPGQDSPLATDIGGFYQKKIR